MTSYSGIFSGILSDAYSDILSGFYFVVFFGILSGILSDIFYLAYIFWHLFWHSIWYAVPAFYLTFYSGTLSGIYSAILSGILAFTLALFLAFYLTYYSGIFWHSLWHGDIGTKICARGWGSGSAHWDLELEVAILHRKEEGEGKTEGRKKEGRRQLWYNLETRTWQVGKKTPKPCKHTLHISCLVSIRNTVRWTVEAFAPEVTQTTAEESIRPTASKTGEWNKSAKQKNGRKPMKTKAYKLKPKYWRQFCFASETAEVFYVATDTICISKFKLNPLSNSCRSMSCRKLCASGGTAGIVAAASDEWLNMI